MPDHTGRRRRQSRLLPDLSLARLFALLGAVAAVGWLLTLPEPVLVIDAGAAPPLAAPTWSGPAPVSQPGQLGDGAAYTPRLYLTTQESVGLARTTDGAAWRVMLRGSDGQISELRRVAVSELAQFDGFAVGGDTVVWAESVSRAGAQARTTLWRANWRTAGRATLVTSNTGEASFLSREYDLMVSGGQVTWAAVGAGGQTEVRSVGLGGGPVTITRLPGQYVLTASPWVVSLTGGRGSAVELVNLSTGERVTVGTSTAEIAACGPQWCRMGVLGADNALLRIDIQRPDGSQRSKIAGSEATPTIADVAILDRFVPLKTDRTAGRPVADVGLSLYDIATGATDLVAKEVANIQAYGGLLWWSTGTGAALTWHVVDLRTVP